MLFHHFGVGPGGILHAAIGAMDQTGVGCRSIVSLRQACVKKMG